MKVFIVSYEHRHGYDVWATRTEAQAEKSTAEVIQEWLEEVDKPELRDEIDQLLQQEKWKEARHLYNDSHGSEWLYVSECDVLDDTHCPAKAGGGGRGHSGGRQRRVDLGSPGCSSR